MAFTQIKTSQTKFLETYLRGTGRTLTEDQARALFDVQNLRARVADMRAAGLNVRRVATKTTGKSAYAVSRRDIFGYQGRTF